MEFPTSGTNPIKVYGLPGNVATEVRAHPALTFPMGPLHRPQFRLLSKPCSVVRDVTLKVLGKLDAASKKSSFHSRMVLSTEILFDRSHTRALTRLSAGSLGCGKSYTLIQAVQYAAAKNWLVLYFPHGAFRHPAA